MAVECREYYEVLGVVKKATADTSGQRPQLARKHHHGVNPGDIRRRNSTRSMKLSRFCRMPKNAQRCYALGPIGRGRRAQAAARLRRCARPAESQFRVSTLGLTGGPETEIRDFMSKESFDGHQPFYAKSPGSNQFGAKQGGTLWPSTG